MDQAHRSAAPFGADCIYHYERNDFIGRGAFGAVYKARVTVKGNYSGEETVAVKEILFSHGDTKFYHESNEHSKMHEKWKLLVDLDHKNVVPYYKITCSFSEHGCLRLELMMRYVAGGDLPQLINRCNGGAELSKKVAINLALQISDGIDYLHQKGIIHGDLKPENVLVEPLQGSTHDRDEFLLQIADIDNCVQLQRSVTCSKDVNHLIGTYRYMSPEMIKTFCGESVKVIGRKTDVWSVGCVLHDLFDSVSKVQGRWLCNENDKVEITRKTANTVLMVKIAGGYVPYISPALPVDLSDILCRCMMVDVSKRTSMKLLLETLRDFREFDQKTGIGLKIGNKSVSIAILRNGVSRILTAFPSVAAYRRDRGLTAYYFGSEAQGYLRLTNYKSVLNLKHVLHPGGDASSEILQELIAYIIQLLRINGIGIHHIERIAMVLPQSIVKSVGAQQNIRSIFERNLVHQATLMFCTSANFLAYASSDSGGCLVQGIGNFNRVTHLIICKAGYNHFLLEVYKIRSNSCFLDRTEGTAVLLNCMGKMRTLLYETVGHCPITCVVGPVNPFDFNCIVEEKQQESEELMRVFLQEGADTGTIDASQNTDVTDGRRTAARMAVNEIPSFVLAELKKRGLLNKKGFTHSSCRILLFGTNSRFLPLRNFLESVQQLPLDDSVLSYVDTSEALGAAVASYLVDASARTEGSRRPLEIDIQKDNFFDLAEISKLLSKSIDR